MSAGLEWLLNPRGIAVIGASAESSRPGAQSIAALKAHGYAGGVYPVNPKYTELAGYRCYASIGELPREAECDVAVIGLPAHHVPQAVRECAQRGIRFAVVVSGGFREAGEAGARIEREMLEAAREGGVRLIGPNCLGFVNVHSRAYAAFGSLTRPPLLDPGPVSAVLQSASFGVSVVMQCAAEGVGFRYVVTSGNEADISTSELIAAYVDDPETHVILAYIEGVNDGRAFMSAARRALSAGKPLIVIKAGNTEQGRRAAESHTANLTGDYDIYRAAFRQCGVIEVTDVAEAIDVTRCVVSGRIPEGRRIVVIGGSGGSAAMFADQADELGLILPRLAPETMATLEASLPHLSSLKNPIDYTAGYPREEKGLDFERAFTAVANDPGIDQVAVMFGAAGRSQLAFGAQVLSKLAGETAKPIVVFSGVSEAFAGDALKVMKAAGIPVFSSPKRVATAMARLADYAGSRARTKYVAPPLSPTDMALPQLPQGAVTLDEAESKAVLAAAGIAVTRDRLLTLEPDARACEHLPFPVALKIVSREIAHKSDVGGVRLGIAGPDALISAAREIVSRVRELAPGVQPKGLLACEMVTDGVETIAGVVNDPAFGPVVAFGLGGIYTEVLRDVAYRVAPFGPDEARAMIGELRARAIFEGVRGQPALDVDALVATLVRLSELAWALRERLAELDVNPLLVRPRGRGVIAGDALLVLRAAANEKREAS